MTTPDIAAGAWVAVAVVVALIAGYRVGRRAARVEARTRIGDLQFEKARVVEELTATTLLLDRFLDTAPLGLLVLDADLLVTRANATATNWFDLPGMFDRPSLLAVTRSAELQELATSPELPPRTVKVRTRMLHAQADRLDDGTTILALRDDTRVETLERARRDLVANVSHDLRTPLTSLVLLAETLAERPPRQPERLSHIAGQIQGQVAVLRTLAEGLIELSRLEEGRAVLKMAPEALGELVREAATVLEPQAREREVVVLVEIADDLRVLADRAAMRRALTNLLDNAIRYSPRGGRVTVTAEPVPPDEMVLRVSDEGPGILPSERERVFERFYRGDRSRGSEGAGLGLAVVRHVARGHGGEADVEPTAGPGTTIRLTMLAATDAD